MFACGAGASSSAPPEIPVLGSDATCADRAQARPVCLQAVEARCASLNGSCEATCQPRLGPGSDEKSPALRGDLEEERCRQGCRETAQACRRSLLGRCPTVC